MQKLRQFLQPIIVPLRKFFQKRKRNALRRQGKEVNIEPTIRIPKRSYGAGNGEVTMADCDPKVIYSFGVGKDIRFELDVLKRFNVEIHAFDPTEKTIRWISQQNIPPSITFHPYGIANFDGEAHFYLPENHSISYTMGHGDEKGEVKRLQTIMAELGHNHVDVVKIDIEGAEYDVIEDIAKSNLDIDQLLIEFHHRLGLGTISQTEQAISLLASLGYELFDVSATGFEYGFLRLSKNNITSL